MEKQDYAISKPNEEFRREDSNPQLNLLMLSGYTDRRTTPTSIIEPLPMPGDNKHYSDSPPQSDKNDKQEDTEDKKDKPENEDESLPGVIIDPGEWFKPKNMGNPLNPIYW